MGARAVGLTGLRFGTEMGFHPGKVATYDREPGNPWEHGFSKCLLAPPSSEGFKRLQFPVRLAFAMTINKAQGQSLRVAGINLEQPCFSHRQLYVACSRVGSPEHLFILSLEGKTKNIVYQKALQ
ncbi:ATP-dependent DNA helicase PIF6-like [Macrobrachium nipponense]|uniref:ATP-dependent DNA helicase PIF6-like n=1 Tax=Macrobrachium nipponense TaxID=159736 RepID=UPI0030C8313B